MATIIATMSWSMKPIRYKTEPNLSFLIPSVNEVRVNLEKPAVKSHYIAAIV
jgi:hypothetical protein